MDPPTAATHPRWQATMPDSNEPYSEGGDGMMEAASTAWHRLGTAVPEHQQRDLGQALEAVGLDFEIRALPQYVRFDDGTLMETPGSYALVRTDTREVIRSSASPRQATQNREVFAPLTPLLDEGLARIEAGGLVGANNRAWILVQFDREGLIRIAYDQGSRAEASGVGDRLQLLRSAMEEEEGGGMRPFGVFLNPLSGMDMPAVQDALVRVACANMLQFLGDANRGVSLQSQPELRKDTQLRKTAHRVVRALTQRYERLAVARSVLRGVHLSSEAFEERVLEVAAPVSRWARWVRSDERAAIPERVPEQNRMLWSELRRLWDEGAGHRGDRSAWEAWQGVIQWADHSFPTWGLPDPLLDLALRSLQSLKGEVLRELLELAAEEDPDARVLLEEMPRQGKRTSDRLSRPIFASVASHWSVAPPLSTPAEGGSR